MDSNTFTLICLIGVVVLAAGCIPGSRHQDRSGIPARGGLPPRALHRAQRTGVGSADPVH